MAKTAQELIEELRNQSSQPKVQGVEPSGPVPFRPGDKEPGDDPAVGPQRPTQVQRVVWGGDGRPWDLLVSEDLLGQFAQSPQPIRFAGVMRTADRVAAALRIATAQDKVLGCGWKRAFEGPGNFRIIVPRTGRPVARQIGDAASLPVQLHVYADEKRFSRLKDIVDLPRLGKVRVTMVGCGAVGSEMARQLACAGVRAFHLFDRDFLLSVNIPRHACDERDLFRRKVDAVRRMILRRNPNALVSTCAEDVTGDGYRALQQAIQDSDMVIATTDSNTAQFTANQESVAARRPFVAAGAWKQAFGGEVFWTLPEGSDLARRYGRTPCYHCVFGDARSSESEPTRNEEDAPCRHVGQPGVGIDLSFVTEVALAFVLALLDPESPRAELIAGKPSLVYAHAGRPLEWPGVLNGPFDVRYQKVAFDTSCPVCGGGDSSRLPSPA